MTRRPDSETVRLASVGRASRSGSNRVGRAAPDDQLTELGCACATARQVARVLTQLYDSRLRSSGIEAPQFALMLTLDNEGPCSQSVLGRRYALDKTTVSRNLRLLQRRGWVALSSAADRRERRIALTPEGRRRLALARPEWKKAQADLREKMTGPQWDRMFVAFRAIARAAATIRIEAPAAGRRGR
jgi:DNA-binding MarR family transcriptional regulator